MKHWKFSLTILFVLVSVPVSATKDADSPTSSPSSIDLATGSDLEKIQAIERITKSKDKSQIPKLIELLSSTQNPRIASDSAIALGVIGEKGESTTALKQKIEKTENPEIVYACILALFNIHREDDKRDPEVEAVMKYALEYRRHDPFVSDLLNKLKDRFVSTN